MPYLGDYLGHLMSEITRARMQADLEAVRVAELYASHPLLKHMPVPHFRLPAVVLDVPVAVKGIEGGTAAMPESRASQMSGMRRSFDRVLKRHLQEAGFKLTKREMAGIGKKLDKAAKGLAQPAGLPLSVKHIADKLTVTALAALGKSTYEANVTASKKLREQTDVLRKDALVEFLGGKEQFARLQVLVTASELNETGPPANLLRLHLSVSEQGFEWTVIESGNQRQDRLVPE